MAVICLNVFRLLFLLMLKQISAEPGERSGLNYPIQIRSAFYKKTSLHAGRRVVDGVFETTAATSLMDCVFLCTNHDISTCTSINYREDLITGKNNSNNCELIDRQATEMQSYDVGFVNDVQYTHTVLRKKSAPENFCSSSPCVANGRCDEGKEICICEHGYTGRFCEQAPLASCHDIQMDNYEAGSGNYWIRPNQNEDPIYVYCDMTTEGGMWTLVYNYTFIDYENFHTSGNALVPRPSWPSTASYVQISKTSPVNDYGAVDYSLWQNIGKSFLVMSNINDWVFCQPTTGSLVTPVNGTIDCRNIKNVTANCTGFAPKYITWNKCGPKLYAQNTMYYFDGSTSDCWPTHNPCRETWRDNHKKNVENPSGYIFLRP